MKRVSLCTFAVMSALVGLAHAGRPLATEDAAVIDKGSCELESFLAQSRGSGLPSASGFSVQYGCGVGFSSQLALATARFSAAGQADRTVTLGGKTGLNTPAKDGPAWALAWGLVGHKANGGHFKHETTYVNGVLTQPLAGELKLHANLGWSRGQSTQQNTVGWQLALEQGLGGGIEVMGELFANQRDHSPWLQFGLRWAALPDKLFVDTSYGWQTDKATKPRLFTLGLKAVF